jgi:Tfp pilus assembly protein PilF
MAKSRLDQLLEFLEQDPEDTFVIYGLALEYLNIDIKQAKVYFDLLLEKYSDYLPTYYHAAKLYETLENNKKAIELYEKGIELSTKQNNMHSKRELQNALNLLLFDEED